MKIHKLIEPDNVFIDLAADDVESALAAVADVFAPKLGLDPEDVVGSLLERVIDFGFFRHRRMIACPNC